MAAARDVDTNDGKDVAGRLVVRPFNDARRQSAEGAWAGDLWIDRRARPGPPRCPRFRTPSLQQTFFSYTGATADGVRTRYSPQVFYYYKAFGGVRRVRAQRNCRFGQGRSPGRHRATMPGRLPARAC